MDRANSEGRGLLEQQRRWAATRRLEVDDDDHTADVDVNLFAVLGAESRAELEGSAARPLGDGSKPGPIRGLHSTQALVCNVFDPWRESGAAPLAAALDTDPGSNADSVTFAFARAAEPGVGAELDVWLEAEGGRPTALVASFAEPYVGFDAPLAPEALDAPGSWGALAGCRNLALDLRANPRRFRSLPVLRLLHHALALTRRLGPRGFRLAYVWYEMDGPGAALHRRELDRFRMRVGAEVDLHACTWQEFFRALARHPAAPVGYLDYLAARYFPEPTGGDVS